VDGLFALFAVISNGKGEPIPKNQEADQVR
jgi:hypothetical protein